MAKKGFEASGRMSVEKFEQLFRAEFDVYCDILDEKGKIAKQNATLASLRPKDFKAPGKVDFSLRANMQVANVQKKFRENFGLELQIYKLSKPDEKDTLASLRKGVLLGDDAVGGGGEKSNDVDEATGGDLLSMSNYYNLRFGYCNSESEGDFIDNIDGRLNIYVVDGKDEDGNDYLCLYFNNEFKVIENSSISENLDLLSKHLSTLFSENIAKGLIQSGYDNDPDGIIDNAPDYEEHYFDTRDDDDVDGYMPCFFVVSSVTYDCNCQIDKNTGAVHLDGEIIDNMYGFYGYLDEDESYALGVVDFENN